MKKIVLLTALLMLTGKVCAEPLRVEVFADGEVAVPTVSGVHVITYDLNEATYMQQNAPVFKQGSAEASQAAAMAWVRSPDFENYKRQYMRARFPHALIAKYKLSKIPAIVFEGGTHVIYGSTDIASAIALYRQFIAEGN